MYKSFVFGSKYIDPIFGFVGETVVVGITICALPESSASTENPSLLLPLFIPTPTINLEEVLLRVL